jgi:hypothetical protein
MAFDATLDLVNGQSVSAANLRREYGTGWRIVGKLAVPPSRYLSDSLIIKDKDVKREVDLSKVRSIEFSESGACRITLANGMRSIGMPQDMLGFAGICDKGNFRIAEKHLKAVTFHTKDTAE